MSTAFWIAAISLPFIGAVHRYASSYGYRGVSRRVAFGEAWRVGVALTIVTWLYVFVVVTVPQ